MRAPPCSMNKTNKTLEKHNTTIQEGEREGKRGKRRRGGRAKKGTYKNEEKPDETMKGDLKREQSILLVSRLCRHRGCMELGDRAHVSVYSAVFSAPRAPSGMFSCAKRHPSPNLHSPVSFQL